VDSGQRTAVRTVGLQLLIVAVAEFVLTLVLTGSLVVAIFGILISPVVVFAYHAQLSVWKRAGLLRDDEGQNHNTKLDP
jgi:multisubunit Na+/H+ antiporter MnhG subunit